MADEQTAARLASIKRWQRESRAWEGNDYLWLNRFCVTAAELAHVTDALREAKAALHSSQDTLLHDVPNNAAVRLRLEGNLHAIETADAALAASPERTRPA